MTGPTKLQSVATSTLRRQRAVLLRQLPSFKAVLRGSLIERYKRCGKAGCKCAQGRGHGPKFYLSVSLPERRPLMEYVPQGMHEEVEEFLDNYRLGRRILDEICEINLELLRRRERLD